MSDFKEKLQEAIETKKNDITTYVWKFPKQKSENGYKQDGIHLIDATQEQLQEFYNHCKIMLYNTDPKNVGRYPLLDIIKEQRNKCNAMLFINWLAAGGPNREPYPRFKFFQDMKTFLDKNEAQLPRPEWDTTSITRIMSVPPEFNSLSIKTVFDACLDTLGIFDKRHITNNFIVKMGLWFTQEEIKDLTVKGDNGKTMNRLDVVKQRCDLRPDTKLYINQKGLTYKEFRAMKNLKSKRYSELTTDQLTILRDKILFKLEEEVYNHIQQWKERMEQIKKVAEYKNYEIND